MRKNKHRLPRPLLIVFLAVLISSCGGDSSSAVIDHAGLYTDSSGTQPTTTYEWRDVFYCVISISDPAPNTIIQASWVAVETNRAEPNLVLKIDKKSVSGSPVIFELENIGHFWPVGTYQLFIYLDGTLDQILDFNVVDTDIS